MSRAPTRRRSWSEIGHDCDADVENPPDSVFCSHGADDRPLRRGAACAQVDSGLRLDRPEEEGERASRAADYARLLATDEELLKIFERTAHGPPSKAA